MGRVQFGLIVPEDVHGSAGRAHYREQVDRLLATVTGHFDSAWCIDHLQGDVLEGWTTLAYLAARHPDLRWGHTVLAQSFRNPALVAKMGATFQFLSGGRFILGLGAGDSHAEHLAYGYPFPPARERVAQLDEAARIARALWRGGPASFAGQHYRVADAYCLPAPDPAPTLMIGGGGERRTLRVVAEHADWWNADYYSPAEYAHKLGVLRDHCRAIGRDPGAIVPSCYMGITVSHDPERLVRRRFMGHRGEVHVVSGTPDEVTAQLAAFADAGVRHMQLNFLDFPRTDSLDLFLSDVLPRFDRAGT